MVIANMIGTGIFTSLGYQVMPSGIPDPFAILVIWLLGGIVSLCGATVYGEVATRINRSGGEYSFLSNIYHPLVGFVTGWISLFAGFSGAIAALALAAGAYFSPVLGLTNDPIVDFGIFSLTPGKIVAIVILALVALVHLRGIKFGGIFQNYMTYVKLLLIATFLVIPFLFMGSYTPSKISFLPSEKTWDTIFSLPFAGSLVWVMFAYSGWNASTYIVGNLENPRKNLPYSLLVGTLVVTVIYVLLNFTFMYVATFDELELQVDLGNVVANKILGDGVGIFFSLVFSLALISGVSAMFIAAPRVAEQIGKDYYIFRVLGKQSEAGAPKPAIFFILIVSLLLVLFTSFDQIIKYVSLLLTISSILTVFGLFILRYRDRKNGSPSSPNVVKAWGYPVTPIIFIAICCWMISFFVSQDFSYIWWSLYTILPAIGVYFITRGMNKSNDSH